MSEPLLTALVSGLALLAGALIGYLAAHLRAQTRLNQLHAECASLKAELAAERGRHEERLAALEQARSQLADSFAALSREALKHNSEAFLRLAQENLSRHQSEARAELDKREKSIESLVRPIRETLEKTERQIRELEKERRQAFGSLSEQLRLVADSERLLRQETQNLVNALRRPEVRGRWGEMTLKRLAELAGMVEHCDFYEQEQLTGPEGVLRPDMVVRMPDARELVVDAKTPLDAYLSAVEARSEAERAEHLKRHARKLRERVRELAGKAYWTQFKNSPDFVVLFIPGDQFLAAALEQDPALLEDALADKVILATPTSIVALLRAVAFGWRQQTLAENAERIRGLGEELYRRLGAFTEHLARLGKALGQSVDNYNKAVGSLERQVLPGARRFTELGIHGKRPLAELNPLEKAARTPAGHEQEPHTHRADE